MLDIHVCMFGNKRVKEEFLCNKWLGIRDDIVCNKINKLYLCSLLKKSRNFMLGKCHCVNLLSALSSACGLVTLYSFRVLY